MSSMKKPKGKKRDKTFDYHEVIEFIEKKHNISVRDYKGKFTGGGVKDVEYQDFWHWFTEDSDIHNGCESYLPVRSFCNILEDAPEFVKEIVKLLEQDFGKHADGEGTLKVWIEW